MLAQGKEREAGLSFGKPVTVLRNQPQQGIAPEALKTIFGEDPHKLPAYSGAVTASGSYAIYKLEKVIDAPAPDAAKLQAAGARVGSEIGRELMSAYLASLKAEGDVKINASALEKK